MAAGKTSIGGGARRAVASHRTGRRKGQPETKREILVAARGLFAERGYAGTSMRAIGAAAGVDSALVHHYFGTKEDLFRAVLDVPLDPQNLMARIAGAGREETPARLVETMLDLWDSPETGPQMVGFARRAFADQHWTETVRDGFGATVLRAAASTLLGDVDAVEAKRRVALVMSQMIGVVVLRKVVALEPLASMPAEDLAAVLAPTIARYLDGSVPGSHARTTLDPHAPTPEGEPTQ